MQNVSKCDECTFRAKYDNNPKSLSGRFWRWHIKFCPGWKGYINSLSEADRAEIMKKYKIEFRPKN